MNCSMPGLLVHHQLPEFTLTHVHRVSDAIQPSHPLSSPSPPAPSPFLPTSSLSRVQGYPQDGWCQRMKKDKEIRKSWHRVTKLLWWARPTYFIFREGFCTLSCTYSKVKNAESTQHSISINFYRYQVPSCKSLIFCILSYGPEACWYFMTPFW